MIADSIPELKKLTTTEKLQLASELWDEVENEAVTDFPKEVVTLLEERMEEFRKDPSTARPWSEVRKDIFGKCGN